MKKFNKILLPTDLSEEGISALDLALQLADNGSEIHFVFVMEPPTMIDGYAIYSYEQLYSEIKTDSQKKLYELLENCVKNYPDFTFEQHFIEASDAAHAVVDKAHDVEADLIVISSHGRRGLRRVLMGSVAEGVMRLSDIPVIICKTIKSH